MCMYADSAETYTHFASQLGVLVPENVLPPNSSVALVKVASRYFSHLSMLGLAEHGFTCTMLSAAADLLDPTLGRLQQLSWLPYTMSARSSVVQCMQTALPSYCQALWLSPQQEGWDLQRPDI